VMLVYLLGERLPPGVREANFRYYEPRCGHGSSLSPAIHALVAARLGDIALAEHYFRQAAEIDLADNMGNAAGGVHLGALGGLWQAAVLGFAGLRACGDSPDTHQANLLPSWRSLSMHFQWRGQWHELTLPESVQQQKNQG
jgi:trehalose/maltose hydrolase-like predicted phosphorylase